MREHHVADLFPEQLLNLDCEHKKRDRRYARNKGVSQSYVNDSRLREESSSSELYKNVYRSMIGRMSAAGKLGRTKY